MLLNRQLFTHLNNCTDLTSEVDCSWKSSFLFLMIQISTDCHSYSIRLPNFQITYIYVMVLWSKLKNLSLGTPKSEGIQERMKSELKYVCTWIYLFIYLFLFPQILNHIKFPTLSSSTLGRIKWQVVGCLYKTYVVLISTGNLYFYQVLSSPPR